MVSTSSTSFLGSYSGITMDTIDQLINAESGKLTQYTNKQTALTNEKNAWKDINTRLDSLSSKMDTLKDASTFQSKAVTNSNEDLVTVSGDAEALNSDYKISVEQLATSSQLASDQINLNGKKIDEPLELSGDITFTNADGKAVKLTVTEDQSLKDIVNTINEQSKTDEAGLKAAIIDSRIVVTDEQMGDRTITASGSLTEGLGLADADLTKGHSAQLTINGISVTRDTNNITDVVEGLTIQLNKAAAGETAKISVADDVDKTTKAVQEFVDQYNSVISYIGDALDVGDPTAEGNKTGALVGDSSVMRLQSQLRNLLSSQTADSSSADKSLKDLGIEVDRYGKATLDTSKLKETMAEDPNAVKDFFYQKETVTAEDGTTSTKETGVMQDLGTFVNDYINDKTGVITTKSASIDESIKDLDEQISLFNDRLEVKRQRYIEQFTALDTAMMEAESQMQYLAGQIGSMTGSSTS